MDSDTPLIITGMHRSGTSLLARFVHGSGIDLGNELVGAKKSNVYGHFEDAQILDFQSEILRREYGHPMWVPGPAHPTGDDQARALALIATRKQKPRWGWKEPRTSLFLAFWNNLLPDAQFLFVARQPMLVMDSLSRRGSTRPYQFWSHNTFLKGWLVYNRQCFEFLRDYPARCALVTLDQVLQDSGTFVALLSAWLGIELDADLFRSTYDPAVLAQRMGRRLLVSPGLRSQCELFYAQLEHTSRQILRGEVPGR